MPYSVSYLPDVHVVALTYAGVVGPSDGAGAIADSGVLAEKHGCRRFLADCTGVAVEGATLFDVLAFVEHIVSAPPGPVEREAVVMPLDGAAADKIDFFETACRNRGLNVRVFPDRAAALDWLGV